STAITRIVVEEGHQTDLPCVTDQPSFNKTGNVLKVWWFHQRPGRSFAVNPFYTIDLTSSNQVLRWASEKWTSRAYFSLLSYPYSLKLIRLEHSDAGAYICQVHFKDGSIRNGTVQLQVVVPPLPPHIYTETGEEVQTSLGPLNETSKLVLVCKVKGGKPAPSVTWKRGGTGEIEGNVRTSRIGDTTASILTLHPLQREHHLAEFICESANDEITYHTTQLRLELNRKYLSLSTKFLTDEFRDRIIHEIYILLLSVSPLLVQIRRSDAALSSGYHAEIICEVWGSVPPAKVSWWKNGINLEQDFEHTSMDGNLTTSVVRFQPRAEDNGQSLVCRAENPRMSVLGVREDQWDLNVHYRPVVRVQLDAPGQGSITEGSDISILCLVDANPAPFGPLIWKHNEHKLSATLGSGVSARRNRLHIRNVSHGHAGNYTCEAANGQGSGVSPALFLRIKLRITDVPLCRPHQRIVYHARVGETIRVKCSVTSHPSSVSFRWKVNSTTTEGRVDRFTWDGTTSEAEFTPRDSGDFGTLLCWARNQLGDQREPCSFVIVDLGSPWLADEVTIAATLCLALLFVMLISFAVVLRNRRRDHDYMQEACDSGHGGVIVLKSNGCNNNQFNDPAFLT
ncbi:neural cell adhesion molecule 2-like, partial [Varroa jacobsoni]|uniref:neural cell adhesion molecule 2-like n=1 Tax=Varroa jacobsoni TaxID=62625 RepID=UPI000BF49723